MFAKRMRICGWLAALLLAPACAAAENQESYIKVEIRGTLETGIVAIGGETTGTIIRAGNVVWELEFTTQPELRKLAEKLHQQTVLVTGTYRQQPGVEIPLRHIVTVAVLKPAE